mmetsp:Transcript_9258/g.18227  ORF Transcript_9258/g.18227 Transcript_9258/m.18227 type:complete len:209 (+) Transcript_9258:1554-2180(+)
MTALLLFLVASLSSSSRPPLSPARCFSTKVHSSVFRGVSFFSWVLVSLLPALSLQVDCPRRSLPSLSAWPISLQLCLLPSLPSLSVLSLNSLVTLLLSLSLGRFFLSLLCNKKSIRFFSASRQLLLPPSHMCFRLPPPLRPLLSQLAKLLLRIWPRLVSLSRLLALCLPFLLSSLPVRSLVTSTSSLNGLVHPRSRLTKYCCIGQTCL